MRFRRRRATQRFFAFLTILSVTFTQAATAVIARNREAEPWRDRSNLTFYGCLAFGCSCRQTMKAATNPTRISATAGSSGASSRMIPPAFSGYSSGVNQVPMTASKTMAMDVQKSNLKFIFPVTHGLINASHAKPFVLSLSKHEHRHSPFDRPVLSLPLSFDKLRMNGGVEGLRVNGSICTTRVTGLMSGKAWSASGSRR